MPPPNVKTAPPPIASPPKPASARPPVVPLPPPSSPASPVSRHTPKTFAIHSWSDKNEGTKYLGYAKSGMGKTTLASMSRDPVFIGLDDGGRKIKHPKTGADIQAIPGVETFQDLRDCLHQTNLFQTRQTAVLDTGTVAEILAERYCFANIKTEKGNTAENIESYGYGKGYKHLLDTMRLLISDFEPLVRRGVDILILCQEAQGTVANLEGLDYLQDGPKLTHTKQFSVKTEFIEWVDTVFRIGHPSLVVNAADKRATKGKVAGQMQRCVYTTPELHFVAKNRSNGTLPSVIAFDEPSDDSFWTFAYGGK